MRVEIKIQRPRIWKENFLVDALKENGMAIESFVDNLGENVEILVSNSISVEELWRLKKLKHLIIPTGGTEGVCIRDVISRGIKIYHDPLITSRGIADYTFNNLESLLGKDTTTFLNSSTIGLLGFGNVGKEIYESLKRYRCHFEAFTNKTNPYSRIKARKGISNLLSLLSNSDIIINTLPLTNETNRLLYSKNSQIKAGALVVSVSRAGITNDRTILEDTIRGYLRGAILDVYSEDIDPMKYKHRNIVLTPHIAGIYGEALNNLVLFIRKSVDIALRR